MTTVRRFLEECGFDFKLGRIVIQMCDEGVTPGWGDPVSGEAVSNDDPILDYEFYDGFGGPECPRFIAEDGKQIVFPGQYDGSTFSVRIMKDISYYLDPNHPTPYPGE